jgi:predicted HD superfamily hydrolase involved in NAD metabolism
VANFVELACRVRDHLGQQHRYAHSLRVARCADLLAQRHGSDPARARLAGLLHDLARLYSPERLVEDCETRGFAIDAYEREHPVVLHARLGAALAHELFGVNDPEVLSAIAKHTTGAAEMSLLDRIVYLADSLEPARTFAERGALWQLAMRDDVAAMRELLLVTLRHRVRKGGSVAPATLAAAEAYGLRPAEWLAPEVQASAS